MARINIEDQLFTDGRFKIFSQGKDEALAIGQMVILWRLAQTYWIPEKKEVPINVFMRLNFAQDLIESDLVEVKDQTVYVRGSENQFDWWFSKKENGKKGGRPSKSNAKNNLKKATANRSLTDSKANDKLNLSDENPTIYNLNLQSQSTISNKNIYTEKIEALYKIYPRKEGKAKGIERLKKEIKNDEDLHKLQLAIENYSKITQGKDLDFVKHFSTFAMNWRDYLEIQVLSTPGVSQIENPYPIVGAYE